MGLGFRWTGTSDLTCLQMSVEADRWCHFPPGGDEGDG